MGSGFTWSFNKQFATEFKRLKTEQQDCILDFTDLLELHGIHSGQYSKFPGKLSVSWRGLDASHPNFVYAQTNHLWHYHVGFPEYTESPGGFLTSQWLLHFQFKQGTTHVHIADLYTHENRDGKFYLPSETYLNKDVG